MEKSHAYYIVSDFYAGFLALNILAILPTCSSTFGWARKK